MSWTRDPVHVILMALTMFYPGKNSFRNIALILRTVINIQNQKHDLWIILDNETVATS